MPDEQRTPTAAPTEQIFTATARGGSGDNGPVLAVDLFARAFQICPDAFGISRLGDGIIVDVNSSFVHTTGYSREEVIGQPIARLGIWANPQQREQMLDLLSRQGAVRDFEFSFRTKEGEQRDALLSADIMAIGDEEFLLALWRDVTASRRVADERERLVGQLRDERAFLQEVLRQMQKGVLIAEAPSGRLIMGNEQVARIWGHSGDAAASNLSYDQYQGFHPDGIPYQPDEWPLARSLRGGDVVLDEEIDFLRGDGSHGAMSVSSAPIRDTEGRIIAAVETFHDISELRRAAAELEQHTMMLQQQAELIDLAHDAIISRRIDGQIVFWNHGAAATYGWPREQAVGRIAHRLLRTRFPEPLAAIEAELLAAGHWEGELIHSRRDGSRVVAESRWSLQRDSTGEPLYVLEINNDITPRKRAEEDLKRYTERLEALRDLDRAILAMRSPADIARTALERIRRLIPSRAAEVLIFGREDGEARLLAASCDAAEPPAGGASVALAPGDWGDEYRSGKVLQAGGAATKRIPTALGGLLDPLQSACISVPLIADDQLIGALNVWSAGPEQPAPQHHEIGSEVGNELAIAIQKSRLFEQVQDAGQRLQQLSRRLIEAQEQERRLLARELHDELGQVLTAVQINMAALRRNPAAGSLVERIDESIAMVERALEQVKSISLDLRPSLLDDLGLAVALNWYADKLAARSGIEVSLAVDGLQARLPDELETTLFRIVQEALTNVVRHAGAQKVQITLRRHDNELTLIVRDDGRGFDTAAARAAALRGTSLGLLGMQERAELAGGNLTILSAGGQGTTVTAHFLLRA